VLNRKFGTSKSPTFYRLKGVSNLNNETRTLWF
jgi:hypothetical protein